MNNYSTLKELLDLLYTVLDKIEESGAKPEGLEASLRDIFGLEVHTYLMYLSASDGVLSTEERNFMNYMFDADMSSKDYAKFINENNIYSYEFEEKLPIIIQIVTRYEMKLRLFAASNDIEFDESIVIKFADFYHRIGKAFISCDGVDENEENEMNTYVEKLYTKMLKYAKEITGVNDDDDDDDDDVVFLGKKH